MNDAIMIIIMKNCNDFQELQMTSKVTSKFLFLLW